MKNLTFILSVALCLSACGTFDPQRAQTILLDSAATVTAALTMRDSYIEAREVVAANLDKYSVADQSIIMLESENVEAWYNAIKGLSDAQGTELVMSSDELVTRFQEIRDSAQALSDVLARNLDFYTVEQATKIQRLIKNHRIVEAKVAKTLAVGDREAKAEAILAMLKSITQLAVVIVQVTQ